MEETCRLAILITDGGLDAFILSESSGSCVVKKRVEQKWHPDPESQLRNIEDTVYDNADLIDDIPVAVFVETKRMAMIPADAVDDESDMESVASYLFPESGFEPLVSLCGDECVMSMIPAGVLSFIGRTFPVASVKSSLVPLIDKFRKSVGASECMYVNLHDGKVDIIAFSDENLRICTFQEYKELTDALYFIVGAWNTAGFDSSTAELYISGDKESRMQLTPMLRRYIDYVVPARLPSGLPQDVPLCVALDSVL